MHEAMHGCGRNKRKLKWIGLKYIVKLRSVFILVLPPWVELNSDYLISIEIQMKVGLFYVHEIRAGIHNKFWSFTNILE
jgi:hypothetical protein